MRYDFPVPAVPETIILRGGGLMGNDGSMVLLDGGIDLQLLPLKIDRISCGGEDMLSSCLSLL